MADSAPTNAEEEKPADSADAEKPADSADAEKPASTLDQAIELRQNFLDATEQVRTRTDLAAKIVAGLGTAGLSAISVDKAFDVFPLEGQWFALVLMVAGLVLMALVLFIFTRRLWKTQLPIIMRSDHDQIDDLDERERAKVGVVYGDFAALNDASTLRAYEARGHRLDRAARHFDDEQAAALRQEALEINADVLAAEARAALIVIRQRASDAIFGMTGSASRSTTDAGAARRVFDPTANWLSRSALALYLAFFLGLLLFGTSADKISAARSGDSDAIASAKGCGDAITANAPAGALPDICDPSKTTAGQAIALAKSCADAITANVPASALPPVCSATTARSQTKPPSGADQPPGASQGGGP